MKLKLAMSIFFVLNRFGNWESYQYYVLHLRISSFQAFSIFFQLSPRNLKILLFGHVSSASPQALIQTYTYCTFEQKFLPQTIFLWFWNVGYVFVTVSQLCCLIIMTTWLQKNTPQTSHETICGCLNNFVVIS